MPEKLNVVIAGGGRVGHHTAEMLTDRNHDVMVIEQDSERCEHLSEQWIATVIEGDACDPEILDQVSLGKRDVLAALTGHTGTNMAICMTAKEIAPDIRTVARIDRDAAEHYGRFVDGIVFPELAGARVATNRIVGAAVQTLSDVTGPLEIMEIRVAEDAPAADKSLSDIRLPEGALVVSDDDGERVAGPETTLDAGTTYVVAAESDVVGEVMNLFRG
jgi:trk system potassium uptake protein TrkA